jgi:threonylcarbamoyladenosine tRNA methylthiotransferase MtaB
VPSLRGKPRSVALSELINSAREIADNGVKEIVLTGIEISAYRNDHPGAARHPSKGGELAELAVTLADALPDVRFRLGSLDPSCVTGEFSEILSKHKNICPHFHLAIQSGCDKTLAAMGRNYDTAAVERAAEHLRGAFDCTLGCDLIVGFPGETEKDFLKTLSFIEHIGSTFAHIFPFSSRPGTKAAELPGHLTNAVKRERARHAALTADRLFVESAAKQSELNVLFETEKDGESVGHSDNYFEVRVMQLGLHNEIRRVKIFEVNNKTLYGGLL